MDEGYWGPISRRVKRSVLNSGIPSKQEWSKRRFLIGRKKKKRRWWWGRLLKKGKGINTNKRVWGPGGKKKGCYRGWVVAPDFD